MYEQIPKKSKPINPKYPRLLEILNLLNIIVDRKPKPTTDNKMSTYEKIKIAKFDNIL